MNTFWTSVKDALKAAVKKSLDLDAPPKCCNLVEVEVPFSSSITFDAAAGDVFSINVNAELVHVIQAPLNPEIGKVIYLNFRNVSASNLACGGSFQSHALIFKNQGLGNCNIGKSITYGYRFDGVSWRLHSPQINNVPN